jgi:hypothetical protein
MFATLVGRAVEYFIGLCAHPPIRHPAYRRQRAFRRKVPLSYSACLLSLQQKRTLCLLPHFRCASSGIFDTERSNAPSWCLPAASMSPSTPLNETLRCFSLLCAVPCLGGGSPTPDADSCHRSFPKGPLFQYLAMVHALPLSNRTASTKGAAERSRIQTKGIHENSKALIVAGTRT